MAELIYALCAITSLFVVILLARAYRETSGRLSLWTLLCFLGLALNNVLLFMDEVLLADGGLTTVRSIPAAAGVLALVYGLVWETRD